jgi:CelD/BcsL family acetyltransferase involved in cellulose biosynthesis
MNYAITDDTLGALKSYRNDPKQKLNWSTVFVLPEWMETWWGSFGAGWEMKIRSVHDGGDVVGIAPLMVRDEVAGLIGSTDVCDYLDFIVAPGREADFCDAILDDVKVNGIKQLDLKHVRPDSVVMTYLAPLAESRGYNVLKTREDVSLEMELPATFDEYLESLSTKQRHEVRRKLRRLNEAGDIVFKIVSDNAGLPAAIEVFFKMFVESRQDKASFLTPAMESFFRSIVGTTGRLGLLKLGVLELDGRPLAEIMCFDYAGCLYLYNSGYDPDYVSLSAGLLSKVLAIKDSIEKGKRRFDFLKGAEVYKSHLGGHEIPLYQCRITI